MRDRREIEREMYNAREDLEQRVNELRHMIAEKFEIRAKARHKVDEQVDKVKDTARRGLDRSIDLMARTRDGARDLMFRTRDGAVLYFHKASRGAREHKGLLAVILGGLTLLTVGAVLLVRRRHRRRWLFT